MATELQSSQDEPRILHSLRGSERLHNAPGPANRFAHSTIFAQATDGKVYISERWGGTRGAVDDTHTRQADITERTVYMKAGQNYAEVVALGNIDPKIRIIYSSCGDAICIQPTITPILRTRSKEEYFELKAGRATGSQKDVDNQYNDSQHPVLMVISDGEVRDRQEHGEKFTPPHYSEVKVYDPAWFRVKGEDGDRGKHLRTIRLQAIGHAASKSITVKELRQGVMNYAKANPYSVKENCHVLAENVDRIMGIQTNSPNRLTRFVDTLFVGADRVQSTFSATKSESRAGTLFSSFRPLGSPPDGPDHTYAYSPMDSDLRSYVRSSLTSKNHHLPGFDNLDLNRAAQPRLTLPQEDIFSKIPQSHKDQWRDGIMKAKSGGEAVAAIGVTAGGAALSAATGGTVTLVPCSSAAGGFLVSFTVTNPIGIACLVGGVAIGVGILVWDDIKRSRSRRCGSSG
ncbi:hypothetical protein BKA61DRAFT_599658 [Leptodontidium sp. MPI-SDFR-AT-0119]|nr:hypothetical protein BKA61DRAFT_599658 [Leptodontidium sp. MPI-SDFR-AT-0119]